MSINLPKTLKAGDTLAGTANYNQYPANDGWLLTVALFNATGAMKFTATADGAIHKISVPAATTANWIPGSYGYSVYVEKAAERYSLVSGVLDIQADPSLAVASDGRSHARKMLDSIEAIIENRATQKDIDMIEGQMNGRGFKRDGSLQILRDKYRLEVAAEQRAMRIANGEKIPTTLKTRF